MLSSSKKPRILVAVLHQGWVRPEMFPILQVMSADPRAEVLVYFTDKRPAERNRNASALYALEQGFDFLISIDHDVVPLRNLIDLVMLDLDVVGCAVPQFNTKDPSFPIYFVGMDRVEENTYREHQDREGLQAVDAVGTGAIVIARRVLEAVKGPFVRKWDEDGIDRLGLDFHFCERAKAADFDVYCHYGYQADHFKGDVSLLTMLNALITQRTTK